MRPSSAPRRPRRASSRSARVAPALLLFALGWPLLGGTSASADDPDPASRRAILLRVAEEEGDAREAALATWNALSWTDRATLLRSYLRSRDRALAFDAAVVVSPSALDLEELHLRSKALLLDPLAFALPPEGLRDLADGTPAFGSAELPDLWKALAARDPDPSSFDYSAPHRCLLPEQVPALIPILETAGPTAFRGLLWDLVLVANSEASDERHGDYVRAFRYGLARLRAEADRAARPAMAAMPAPAGKEEGLPADFLELARATWIEPEHGFGLGGLPEGRTGEAATGTREGPGFWLMRWAWRLEPSEEDVPFLLETTRSPSAMLQVREWAARRIAVLDGRAAGHAYREVLAAGGRVARMAAAEAAVHGRPGAWKDVGEAGSDACWIVDSRAAREAAWQALHRGDVPKSLDEEERWFLACDEHVPVPVEDLRWIAARLGTEGAPLEAEAWFYARAFPEALTKPVAEALAARWAGQAEGLEGFDDEVERALAPMAALAPDATLACLRRWARAAKDEDVRDRALALLARLGDTALVGDMLHVWPFPGGRDALCLGRVKDPRVEAFLRAAVEASDAEEADAEERSAEALATLAVYLGCPEPLASYVGPYARDGVDPGTYARARALVLDEDPIGAVLVCAGQAPYLGGGLDAFSGFGLTDDPRVREQITAWREDRGYGLYWETTAVLALLGDEAAREEWAAFLAEARTFMLDGLQDGRLFTMDGDPEWTARWLSRIDANCCYGWHAQAVIKATYPTFPFRHYAGAGFRARLGGERWFAEHRGTFVRSPLLDGWIPVSR